MFFLLMYIFVSPLPCRQVKLRGSADSKGLPLLKICNRSAVGSVVGVNLES